MGARGPAKRPTQLAILHGEKKSRINTDEPIPMDGHPEPPYDLDDEVRAVWDYTVEQLTAMRTLTPADRELLVAFCEAVVTYRSITAALKAADRAPLIEGAMGGYVKNPLIAMQRDSATLVRVLAREFGLSPSARAEITVTGARKPAGRGPERLLS